MTVAITGGIGSGKTFVCNILSQRGVAVYDCDRAAERLIATSSVLQEALSAAVGVDLFTDRKVDKRRLAQYIVSSEEHAQRINNIVHPAVADAFRASGYEWVESAILFESAFDKRIQPDIIICVAADNETCQQRIMCRDGVTAAQAQAWMARQLPQEEKIRRADYVLYNNADKQSLVVQIDHLLETINNIQHT